MYKTTGIILFSPTRTIEKSEINNPCWCIIGIDDELSKYYRYVCNKLFHIKLQSPKWGPHITIIRNEFLDTVPEIWKSLDRKEIEIEYTNKIKTNGKHFWLPIINNDKYYDIREKMGILDKPEINFHLTFGVIT